MPLKFFEGQIHIVETRAHFLKVLPILNAQKVMGFDTESRPSFKKGESHPVSLVQLSTPTVAFLLRLNMLGVPDELMEVLTNASILKVGASLKDDIYRLKSLKRFTPKGFLDLQDMAVGYEIEDKSLRKLAAIVLEVRLSKSQQLSNWENNSLSKAQARYAATDAWICLAIYNRLMEKSNGTDHHNS